MGLPGLHGVAHRAAIYTAQQRAIISIDRSNIQREDHMRQIILYPGEDGYWVVECPSLPGCISQGKTKEEAITNIQDAIALYIEDMQENGEAVPADTLDRLMVVVP